MRRFQAILCPDQRQLPVGDSRFGPSRFALGNAPRGNQRARRLKLFAGALQ